MQTNEHEPVAQTPSVPPTPPPIEAPRERPLWPCWVLYPVILAITFGILVPRQITSVSYNVDFVMLFGACLLARFVLAHVRKERGYGWVFYMLLLLASPWWMEPIFRLYNGMYRGMIFR